MSYAGLTPQFTSVQGGNITVIGDIVYFGDPSTNGSFRIIKSGADLIIQLRVAGVWTDKDVING